jgi:DNA polymerase III delta subunit
MLTIIHGSDTALSRKYFMDEKQKANDAVVLDAESVNITDLTQLFDGGGLFGETKYLFIEQLLTKRKKSADLPEILSYLEKNAQEHTIIVWEGKELDRSSLMLLKTATVRVFKLPQSLFQFLDMLAPGNGKILIKLFRETVKDSETEMVFFMIVRQVRLLLALCEQTKFRHSGLSKMTGDIDELKRMAPWQKSKLEKQANLFKPDQLLTLYNKLFQIELGQKTGTLSSPLDSTIDFLLAEV